VIMFTVVLCCASLCVVNVCVCVCVCCMLRVDVSTAYRCLPDSKDMPMYDYSFTKVNGYKDLENRYSYNKKLSDY